MTAKDGQKCPSRKIHRSNRVSYSRWTPGELSTLWQNPDMTAAEIKELLPNKTEYAILRARERYGRYTRCTDRICIICDARIIWEESERAKKMKLCKGCYLREMRLREEENKESNSLRQRECKRRKKGRSENN